jgi:hypothetical protein
MGLRETNRSLRWFDFTHHICDGESAHEVVAHASENRLLMSRGYVSCEASELFTARLIKSTDANIECC